MNGDLSREEVKIMKKHLLNCSRSLVFKEMLIKTTLRFHITPVKLAMFQKTNDIKCYRACGERETLIHCW